MPRARERVTQVPHAVKLFLYLRFFTVKLRHGTRKAALMLNRCEAACQGRV